MDAIQAVCQRSVPLALIRFPDRCERAVLSLLKRKELSCEAIFHFEPAVIMSERHALAATSVLTAEMLNRSVELFCEEDSLALYLNEPLPSAQCENSVRLRESGSLCSLLSHIPGAFAFTSPMPDSVLKEYRLVQKKYAAQKMTDAVIYPEDARLTRTENAFLAAVRQTAAELQVF